MGCCGGSDVPRTSAKTAQVSAEDPLTVLKNRLAKGEITLEEYEKLRTVLAEDRVGA